MERGTEIVREAERERERVVERERQTYINYENMKCR
jgi:hypothetical protein